MEMEGFSHLPSIFPWANVVKVQGVLKITWTNGGFGSFGFFLFFLGEV